MPPKMYLCGMNVRANEGTICMRPAKKGPTPNPGTKHMMQAISSSPAHEDSAAKAKLPWNADVRATDQNLQARPAGRLRNLWGSRASPHTHVHRPSSPWLTRSHHQWLSPGSARSPKAWPLRLKSLHVPAQAACSSGTASIEIACACLSHHQANGCSFPCLVISLSPKGVVLL